MKNKTRKVNEGIRNISKKFVDEKKLDDSIKNEIAKEFMKNIEKNNNR